MASEDLLLLRNTIEIILQPVVSVLKSQAWSLAKENHDKFFSPIYNYVVFNKRISRYTAGHLAATLI